MLLMTTSTRSELACGTSSFASSSSEMMPSNRRAGWATLWSGTGCFVRGAFLSALRGLLSAHLKQWDIRTDEGIAKVLAKVPADDVAEA